MKLQRRAPAICSRRSSIAAGPATVSARGPFSAAISSRALPGGAPAEASAKAGRASSSGQPRAAIRPMPRWRCCWALRLTIRRAAVGRSSRPAAQAAATSPTEWPSTVSATMPSARRVSVIATCTANSKGWAMSVATSSAAVTPARTRFSGDQPSKGASTASTLAKAARKRGLCRTALCAMSGICAPLPE